MEVKHNIIIYLLFSLIFSSVFAIGNLLLNSGPSCSVSTLIPGIPNQTVQTMKGTCYSSLICRQQGGVPIGRCGVSNVCCVYPRTCGGIAAQNSTYFTNPGFPSSYNNTNTCSLTVHRIPGINRICQIRLDFVDFELVQPNDGNCDSDRFMVTGQNINAVVPQICGFNTGQHYVDGVQGPFILTVRTQGSGQRRWNILVSQIECSNPSKAPFGCLQYFLDSSGEIMSFNYEFLQQTNANVIKEVNPIPDKLSELEFKGIGYMNGLDYSLCFRKEQFFCSQKYSIINNSTPHTLNDQSFRINSTQVSVGSAGTGVRRCPEDYLVLNGIRFCGYKLNAKAFEGTVQNSDSVTDDSSGPFIARFVSNDKSSGRGFKLSYFQTPCVAVMQTHLRPEQSGQGGHGGHR